MPTLASVEAGRTFPELQRLGVVAHHRRVALVEAGRRLGLNLQAELDRGAARALKFYDAALAVNPSVRVKMAARMFRLQKSGFVRRWSSAVSQGSRMAHKQSYEHLTGWTADLLVSLDIIDSGLLGIVARTSAARRQAILCVLAHVCENAIDRIEHYGQPVLCDEVIALQPVARDLRKLATPALLAKYVPGAGEDLRLALARTKSIQEPEYYRDLVRRCRADLDAGPAGAGRDASPTIIDPVTVLEKALA